MANCKDCSSQNTLLLWVMEYEITGIGKGCAMCKATNAQQGRNTLEE